MSYIGNSFEKYFLNVSQHVDSVFCTHSSEVVSFTSLASSTPALDAEESATQEYLHYQQAKQNSQQMTDEEEITLRQTLSHSTSNSTLKNRQLEIQQNLTNMPMEIKKTFSLHKMKN